METRIAEVHETLTLAGVVRPHGLQPTIGALAGNGSGVIKGLGNVQSQVARREVEKADCPSSQRDWHLAF